MNKKTIITLLFLMAFMFIQVSVYATEEPAYYIYKVTKIGLSYTGASSPEVELPLSQTFDFQFGATSQFFPADNVMYTGQIPDGTITGVWVYYNDAYAYDANGNIISEQHDVDHWGDCRPGIESKTNLNISISGSENSKLIIDYTDQGFVDTKEPL